MTVPLTLWQPLIQSLWMKLAATKRILLLLMNHSPTLPSVLMVKHLSLCTFMMKCLEQQTIPLCQTTALMWMYRTTRPPIHLLCLVIVIFLNTQHQHPQASVHTQTERRCHLMTILTLLMVPGSHFSGKSMVSKWLLLSEMWAYLVVKCRIICLACSTP